MSNTNYDPIEKVIADVEDAIHNRKVMLKSPRAHRPMRIRLSHEIGILKWVIETCKQTKGEKE